MRINSLRLKNFRCFEEREFSFNPQFNLIVGENGSGKTALLEALAVAMSVCLDPKSNTGLCASKKLVLRDVYERDVRSILSLQGDIIVERKLPVLVECGGIVGDEANSWSAHLDSLQQVGHSQHSFIKRVSSGYFFDNSVLPVLAHYGVHMRFANSGSPAPDTSEPKPAHTRHDAYDGVFSYMASTAKFIEWFRRMEWIAFQEKKRPFQLNLMEMVVTSIFEDVESIMYSARMNDLVVIFKKHKMQPFSTLSDGQCNMIALAGDIARSMMQLNPHLLEEALKETPGIVLIDELDLHLHPRWQRHIVDALKKIFPKVQFFATTHSPFLIQSVSGLEGELLMLDGNQIDVEFGNKGVETIAKDIMGVDRPDVGAEYEDMVEAAKDYLQMLDEAEKAPREKLNEYKERLSARIAPYADNPAFQAFLELKRAAKLPELDEADEQTAND